MGGEVFKCTEQYDRILSDSVLFLFNAFF